MPPARILAKRILIALVAAFALVYAGDYVSLRVRMLHAKPGDPFETVTALRILAIGEKGNKTEYSVDPVQPQQTAECVHSLFPHRGDSPCWYLKQKFAQPIPMAILSFAKHGGRPGAFTNSRRLFRKSALSSPNRGAAPQ